MRLVEHLPRVVAELLRSDERRVLLGEDVADGTMLGLSRLAVDDAELRHRVVSTPLVPSIVFAHAAGLALAGLRPMLMLSSAMPLLEGLAGLREAARLAWRTHDGLTVPLLIVAPVGPGFELGGDAGESPEAIVSRITGLRVLVLGDPADAPAVLGAAAEFWAGEEPTLVLIPRALLLGDFDPDAAPQQLDRPFACARVVRDGTAATIFAWGETVKIALDAARTSELDVGVIDVEAIAPLPHAALVEHARATGKIIIAHAGPRFGGIGAELAAMLADDAIFTLDAPIIRVCGAHGPFGGQAEARAVPSVAEVVDAIDRVVNI